jgi:hypothetical protein
LSAQIYCLSLNGNISSGTPRALFETNINVGPNKDQYAVAPDGQRFLLLKPITETKLIPIMVIRFILAYQHDAISAKIRQLPKVFHCIAPVVDVEKAS